MKILNLVFLAVLSAIIAVTALRLAAELGKAGRERPCPCAKDCCGPKPAVCPAPCPAPCHDGCPDGCCKPRKGK